MPELRVTPQQLPQVREASTAVQVNASAAMAPGKGLESFGGDVAQTGRQAGVFFEEMGKRMQSATDFAKGIELENARNKTHREIWAELQDPDKGIDEQEWSTIYANRMSALDVDGILEGVSDESKVKILGQHQSFLDSNLIKTDTEGFKSKASKMKAAGEIKIRDEIENLNPDGIRNTLHRMVEANLSTEEEAFGINGLEEKALEEVDKKRYTMEAISSPIETMDKIDQQRKGEAIHYPNLKTVDDLDEAKRSVESIFNDQSEDTYNFLDNEIDKAIDETAFVGPSMSRENILGFAREKVVSGHLNEGHFDAIRNRLSSGLRKSFDGSKYFDVWSEINSFNPNVLSGNDKMKEHNRIKSMLVAASDKMEESDYNSLSGDLRDKLDSSGNWSMGNPVKLNMEQFNSRMKFDIDAFKNDPPSGYYTSDKVIGEAFEAGNESHVNKALKQMYIDSNDGKAAVENGSTGIDAYESVRGRVPVTDSELLNESLDPDSPEPNLQSGADLLNAIESELKESGREGLNEGRDSLIAQKEESARRDAEAKKSNQKFGAMGRPIGDIKYTRSKSTVSKRVQGRE
jgi:hypothetical protein